MGPTAVTIKQAAPPATAVVVKKGLSMRTGVRFFGWGTVLGGAVGFVAGFSLAQAIYSDEKERAQVKRTIKITAAACGGAALVGALGALLSRG